MSNRLPKGWVMTELDNCSKILDNFRKPINSKERTKRITGKNINELFSYYGATGKVGYIDDYLIEGRYILIGEDGAPFLETFKNIAYIVDGKIWVNNHAHILDSLTDNSFLCHFLNQFDFTGYVTGTTRLKLTQGNLKKIPCSPFLPSTNKNALSPNWTKLFPALMRSKSDFPRCRSLSSVSASRYSLLRLQVG